MTFHTAAFFENINTATLDNIAALADSVLQTSGDDLIVPQRLANLAGIRAGGASMTRARFVSAYLRSRVLPEIHPVGIVEPESPIAGFHEWWDTPLKFTDAASERCQIQVVNGGAEDDFTVLWLTDKPLTPVKGPWFRVRATTAASAMTANAWNARTLTLDQALPPGNYALGGMRPQSTSCIAARAIFTNQVERPGCTGVDANADIQPPVFRYGGLGIWGTFAYDQPPTVEFLVDLADNESQIVDLDVMKIG